MEPVSDTIAVASTVVDTLTLAEKSRKGIKYYFNKFLRRKIKVLVYGDSGVGKTQFLMTITGKNSYIAPTRTRQVQHYDLVLRSGRKVRFIDTPGHKSTQKARNQALNAMTKGKVDGIINLVDYGYQDSEQVQENLDKVFRSGSNDVKEEYLRDNRKLEIDRTREVISRISADVTIKWFITLINKADVWNEKRQEVIGYYEGEEFKEVMENLEHATTVTTCPFCSVITPFGNRPMKLTYSERNKKADYDNLIVTIEEFINGCHEQ